MSTKKTEEKKVRYGEGTRSAMEEAYHLIAPEGLRALGRRCAAGEIGHGEGNWKHYDKQGVKQIFNHIVGHLYDELSVAPENTTEENAGAIMWGGMALAYYAAQKPEIYRQAVDELFNGVE